MAAMYPLIDSLHAGSLADINHVVLFMQGQARQPSTRCYILADYGHRKQGL